MLPAGKVGLLVARKAFEFKALCGINLERYAPIAQLVEHFPFKEVVLGSIPSGCTIKKQA